MVLLVLLVEAAIASYCSGGSLAARSGQLRTISARISSSIASIESNDSISRRMAASSSVESTRPRKISMGMVDRHHTILEVCKLDCVYYTPQQFLLGTFASARGILNGNDTSV